MEFRVSISPSAQADAEAAYQWIKQRDPDMADNWFDGLIDAISKLERFPARCPVALKSLSFALRRCARLDGVAL